MKRNISIALVVSLLPALLLYLWKLTYSFSDWAILWVLILAAMIFKGNWLLVIAHWRAERGIVLRPESWISRWLTGKIWAFLSSTLLVMALVPALAWIALTIPALDAAVFLALAFASAWLFLWVQSFLARYILPPFDKNFATGPSAWLIGLPFSIIIFFVTWHTTTVPVEMLSDSFLEAVMSGMRKLPERRGWIAEILALGYAFDGAKVWLVVQLREYPVIALLFNLHMALVGFLAARASVVVTHFIETHYDGKTE